MLAYENRLPQFLDFTIKGIMNSYSLPNRKTNGRRCDYAESALYLRIGMTSRKSFLSRPAPFSLLTIGRSLELERLNMFGSLRLKF